MSAPGIVVILWVLFYAYWMIAAVGVKRNVRTQGQTERWGLRLLVIAGIIFLRVPGLRQALLHYQTAHVGPTTELVGFLLCVCGFAFAIWARLHLGRNWGQPMTLKQGHELVTTGPFVRASSNLYGDSSRDAGLDNCDSLLDSRLHLPYGYFVYSAHTEERIMTSQFPDQYPEYKKRTRMLVPLVW